MMGFRKVPVWLLYSPVFSALTSFQRDLVWCAQLARCKRNCLPYDEATLKSVLMPSRHWVSLQDLAKARDHLVAVGVFKLGRSPRKMWLELTPEYRNNDGENETSFGEGESPPKQQELPMAQLIHIKQPAESRVRKRARATESARASCGEVGSPESGTRELLAGKDSETEPRFARFARDASAEADELWQRLCAELGRKELQQNGAMWLKRYRLCREALDTALRDWLALSDRKAWTAAKYLTVAFENEKRKWRTSA